MKRKRTDHKRANARHKASEEVLLRAGDCVVQNGTWHGWYNKGDEACLMAFVLVGAVRK